jgi:transposase
VQCYFRNGERRENGEWSYSTSRVLEKFQQKFPEFQGTCQQLAQKVYKCVNMFLETGSVLCKKGSGRPTKRTAENIEGVEQRIAETPNKSIRRLTQEINLSFGTVQLIIKKDLHFFPCCA